MIQDIIGYTAGTIIILSFVPQIIKSYKTRSVKDLSLIMLLAIILATILWIVYGFMISSIPVILVNSIYVFVVLFQLYLKMKYE